MIITTASAARVLDRYLIASRKRMASVVLTDSPPGWDWGWFGTAEPPLAIVPMNRQHRHLGRVILEDRHGARVFEPVGKIPQPVLDELAAEVDLHDFQIEDAWAYYVAIRDWIRPEVRPNEKTSLMVWVYAGTGYERMRLLKVSWPKIIGDRSPEDADVKIDAEAGELIVGAREARPIRLPFRHVIFQTSGAVIGGKVVTEYDWGRELHARLHRVVKKLPSDFTPYGREVRDGKNDCSCGCRYYYTMAPPLQQDWGVCVNPASPRAGMLTFEHQGCGRFEKGFVPIRPPA